MAAKKRARGRNKVSGSARIAPRTRLTGLRLTLAQNYLLEALYANEFANMPREHADAMAAAIKRLDDTDLNGDVHIQKMVDIFLSSALSRANTIRAKIGTPSGRLQ